MVARAAVRLPPPHSISTTPTTMLDDYVIDQQLMQRYELTIFSAEFADSVDGDDWSSSSDALASPAALTSHDDDDVNGELRLSWFQSYYNHQLQQLNTGTDVTPALDDVCGYTTGSLDAEIYEPSAVKPRTKNTESQKSISRTSQRRRSANVRERCRMKSINAAFDRLRALLPPPQRTQTTAGRPGRCPARNRRCGPSKAETLRLAVSYIGCLTRLLKTADPQTLPPSARDDRKSDALTGIVVVNTRPASSGHSGEADNISTYSVSWSYAERSRVHRTNDVVVAKLWTPGQLPRRSLLSLSPAVHQRSFVDCSHAQLDSATVADR